VSDPGESESFHFDDPDHVIADAIGEPGDRVFFLQASEGGRVATFKCEKAQVAALAEHLARLLEDQDPSEPDLGPPPAQPVVAEWIIGGLGLAYDESRDRIVVLIEQFVRSEDDEPDAIRPAAATARFSLTRSQAAGFVARARALVSGGRPLCPICGLPMDPEGHVCPRSNGHHPTS
jgi:uncharacterized repeat protein (TIGR03847 family)